MIPRVVLGCAIALVAAASVASGGSGGRVSAEDVVAAEAGQRGAMLDATEEERRALARGLVLVAQDEGRPTSERADAILLLGRLPVKESIEFCFAHIGLELPVEVIVNVDDANRRYPCRFALGAMGPSVFAPLLAWVRAGERSPEQLRHAAWVATRALGQPEVKGRARAHAVVEALVPVGDDDRSVRPLLRELSRSE